MSIENETDRAVASILGQYNLAKANMEIGSQPTQEIICTESEMVDTRSESSESLNNNDDSKVMEVAPSNGENIFITSY